MRLAARALAAVLALAPAAGQAQTLAEKITWVVRNTDIATRTVADISDEEITWIVPFLVRRSPAGHAWGWFRSESFAPPPGVVPDHMSSIEYYEVDCGARTMKLISGKYAAEHGLRGAARAVRGGEDDWKTPTAGSSAERRLETICSPTLAAADPSIAELRDTLTKLSKARATP